MLLWRSRLNPTQDLSPTLGWLHSLEGDSQEMLQLQKLISAANPGVLPYSDGGQFVQHLEALLLKGELIPVWHEKGIRSKSAPAPARSSDSTRSTSRPSSSSRELNLPPQEPATFPTNIDPAAIARAKREAARLGIPFCEECLKQAGARTS
ncbi:MAG TPA: hypothetical protein VEQ63_10630, partial [Bryobacteraceae bacterium]|nr:hypothetical protein [Bryobacteraceae bacterium]